MIAPVIAGGLKIASGVGVNTIVGCVVKPYIPATIGPIRAVCVEVACLGISGVVTDQVNQYIDKQIDAAAKFVVDNNLDEVFKKKSEGENEQDSN